MEHKLHVKKVLLARDKLRPLSDLEKVKKAAVVHEEKSIQQRTGEGVPDATTVFSQARNGRTKRVEDSLNADFPIDEPDEKGNTLLLVGAQNCNRKLIELCLNRGARINHQNATGNTALHFAMAYDTEGTLGEFLIQKGADDTIENSEGLTPYDGIGSSN
jgi:ankyrin repeat protein